METKRTELNAQADERDALCQSFEALMNLDTEFSLSSKQFKEAFLKYSNSQEEAVSILNRFIETFQNDQLDKFFKLEAIKSLKRQLSFNMDRSFDAIRATVEGVELYTCFVDLMKFEVSFLKSQITTDYFRHVQYGAMDLMKRFVETLNDPALDEAVKDAAVLKVKASFVYCSEGLMTSINDALQKLDRPKTMDDCLKLIRSELVEKIATPSVSQAQQGIHLMNLYFLEASLKYRVDALNSNDPYMMFFKEETERVVDSLEKGFKYEYTPLKIVSRLREMIGIDENKDKEYEFKEYNNITADLNQLLERASNPLGIGDFFMIDEENFRVRLDEEKIFYYLLEGVAKKENEPHLSEEEMACLKAILVDKQFNSDQAMTLLKLNLPQYDSISACISEEIKQKVVQWIVAQPLEEDSGKLFTNFNYLLQYRNWDVIVLSQKIALYLDKMLDPSYLPILKDLCFAESPLAIEILKNCTDELFSQIFLSIAKDDHYQSLKWLRETFPERIPASFKSIVTSLSPEKAKEWYNFFWPENQFQLLSLFINNSQLFHSYLNTNRQLPLALKKEKVNEVYEILLSAQAPYMHWGDEIKKMIDFLFENKEHLDHFESKIENLMGSLNKRNICYLFFKSQRLDPENNTWLSTLSRAIFVSNPTLLFRLQSVEEYQIIFNALKTLPDEERKKILNRRVGFADESMNFLMSLLKLEHSTMGIQAILQSIRELFTVNEQEEMWTNRRGEGFFSYFSALGMRGSPIGSLEYPDYSNLVTIAIEPFSDRAQRLFFRTNLLYVIENALTKGDIFNLSFRTQANLLYCADHCVFHSLVDPHFIFLFLVSGGIFPLLIHCYIQTRIKLFHKQIDEEINVKIQKLLDSSKSDQKTLQLYLQNLNGKSEGRAQQLAMLNEITSHTDLQVAIAEQKKRQSGLLYDAINSTECVNSNHSIKKDLKMIQPSNDGNNQMGAKGANP